MEQNIILDTDVGFDDVFALCLLLWKMSSGGDDDDRKMMNLRAVSTVKGLQLDTDHAARIVERILNSCSDLIVGDDDHKLSSSSNNDPVSSIKIFSGSQERILPEHGHCFSEGEWFTKEYQYKTDNMADLLEALPLINSNKEYEKLNDMLEWMKSFPDQYFTLLCTGPLTNIAKLLEMDRELILRKVGKLVIMGGSLFNELEQDVLLNGSEWNFYCDGKAAEIVLEAFGTKVELMSIYVANLRVLNQEQIKELASHVHSDRAVQQDELEPIRRMLKKLLTISFDSYAYDPVAATYLFNPSFFEMRNVKVKVYSEKPLEGLIKEVEYLKTDLERNSGKEVEITAACGFNRDAFFEMLKSLIA